jgi:hypothetical protein
MNNKKENYQKGFLLFFILILIIILIVVFLTRSTISKSGSYLTKLTSTEQSTEGYGTYNVVDTSPCLTADGKCNNGIKRITEYCTPNPTTGRGCIDSNGEQTFAPRVTTINCLPNCRKTIFKEVTNTFLNTCRYEAPNDSGSVLCIPPTANTFNYRIFSCVNNDSKGDNACSYTCGSDGRNKANQSVETVSTSPSYIPACVNNLGNSITLNSLAQADITNLGQNGFTLSKGYVIKNVYNLDGTLNPDKFSISPPYNTIPTELIPTPVALSEITRQQLVDLDNTLIVYENCIMPTERVKPTCGTYKYYEPTSLESGQTLINGPILTNSTTNFITSNVCFNNPYWNTSSTKYLNPYVTTSSKYSLSGLGTFGLTYSNYSCMKSNPVLTQVPGTGTGPDPVNNPALYYIPGAFGGPNEVNYCTPFTSSTVEPPTSNTFCYNSLNDISNALVVDKSYNICDVTYPDGSHPPDWTENTKTPGLIQNCQYLPFNSQLDFSSVSSVTVNTNLQSLFGNFVQLQLTNNYMTYFLGLRTSPCESSVDSNTLAPLTNCSYIKNLTNNFSQQDAAFIYDGGSGNFEAGNFWNKPGCDNEMIQLTSALNLILSPRTVNASSGNTQTILCDIYAYFGNIYGYLTHYPVSGKNLLKFQAIPVGDMKKTDYTVLTVSSVPIKSFNLVCDYTNPSSPTFLLKTDTNADIYSSSFDGYKYDSANFNISTGATITSRVNGYNEIVKKTGLYQGQNVTVAATFQRNFMCYATTCDLKDGSVPCFPKTCNLYYDYNQDKC